MTGADRWLDASDWVAIGTRRDLQLALHAIGVGRLREVASLEVRELLGERDSYALPLREGFSVEAEAGSAAP